MDQYEQSRRRREKGSYCDFCRVLGPRFRESGGVSPVEFIGWASEPVKLVEALAGERLCRLFSEDLGAAAEGVENRIAARAVATISGKNMVPTCAN